MQKIGWGYEIVKASKEGWNVGGGHPEICWLTLELDPSNQRLLTLSQVPGMNAVLTISTVGTSFQG